MNCQWCAHNTPAKWWAKPVVGPESAMCQACLERVGKKDPHGKFIASPIEQYVKEQHP